MHLQQIDPDIFISAKISIEDIKTLAQTGFKTIICNHPDHEDPHQPDFSIIKVAAYEYDIKADNILIVPPTIKQSDIEAMKTIIKQPLSSFSPIATTEHAQ
ncbi:uncharacterized protein (TIGR01244 family) [Bartonella callosciuri]|uniref:Uncharacterized protein (TIGR01244 family) n=1 Tax=Bartonella callosciuri TaxID=686223 RepID=A0A840NXB9_9HYPH|nr:uncharacterized protein (TIGR01244 family) [Bartonella callosciuri]